MNVNTTSSPDKALAELRTLALLVIQTGGTDKGTAQRLAQAFDDLDHWVAVGGKLPTPWAIYRPRTTRVGPARPETTPEHWLRSDWPATS